MMRQLIRKYMKKSESAPASEASVTGAEIMPDEWESLDESARTQWAEAFYSELKKIAERQMRSERADHTLQPTALVNEFFLRLARQKRFSVNGRAHFLAIASRAMRRVLIDHARWRNAARHGGEAVSLPLERTQVAADGGQFDMLHLDEVLEQLAAEEPRMGRVVELKYFGGLTFSEIAHVLSVSERTAKRDWETARTWLYKNLKERK